MKKFILLSMTALIFSSISLLAKNDKAFSQDNDENSTNGNLSVVDQDTTSKKTHIKQYTFNSLSQNSIHPVKMSNGKVSGYGSSGLKPNYVQYISAFKGEKATSIYGNRFGSGVILVTKHRTNEIKVENDSINK